MELTVSKRATGKTNAKQIRREGKIPAVLYSKGEAGKEISLDGIAFKKILNTVERGTLSSKIFTLDVDGKKTRALVKDIQYNVVTYDVIHLDFIELHDNVPITLNVPLNFVGAMECAGVKLGGVLRQVIRSIKVTCLPKNIPDHFDLDVRDLQMGQTLKLNVLSIPSEVRPITDLKEVAVVVSRR